MGTASHRMESSGKRSLNCDRSNAKGHDELEECIQLALNIGVPMQKAKLKWVNKQLSKIVSSFDYPFQEMLATDDVESIMWMFLFSKKTITVRLPIWSSVCAAETTIYDLLRDHKKAPVKWSDKTVCIDDDNVTSVPKQEEYKKALWAQFKNEMTSKEPENIVLNLQQKDQGNDHQSQRSEDAETLLADQENFYLIQQSAKAEIFFLVEVAYGAIKTLRFFMNLYVDIRITNDCLVLIAIVAAHADGRDTRKTEECYFSRPLGHDIEPALRYAESMGRGYMRNMFDASRLLIGLFDASQSKNN